MNKFLILTIALAIMLVLPSVSALGETKDIIAPTPSTPYGSVDIYTNWKIPLISSKLSTYTLLDNGDSVIDAWASGTVTLYSKNTLFSNMEFKSKFRALETVKYIIYYNDNEAYEDIENIYKEVCTEDVKNGTVCSKEIVDKKTVIKYREVMKEYKGEELAPGTYKWRIEASKPKPNYALDWIGEAQGVKLDNWAWWNVTFLYKKPITLTGPIGANYSVNLQVIKNANIKSDYSDIRFLDTTETSELGYWIEDSNATSASVWVKVQNNNTIYMYYGYAGATTTSSMTNAFIVGDDFNDNSLNSKWLTVGCGGPGLAELSSGLLNITCTGTHTAVYFNRSITEYANYQWRTRVNYYNGGISPAVRGSSTFCAFYEMGLYDSANTIRGWEWTSIGSGGCAGEAQTAQGTASYSNAPNTWYNTTVAINGTKVDFYVNDLTTLRHTFSDGTYTAGGYVGWRDYELKSYVDYAYVLPIVTYTPGYSFGTETGSNALTVTLNSPADNYNISTSSVTFNCSATDETGVLNLTLVIDGVNNYTITGGVGQNLSLQSTKSLSEGSHNWTCTGSDGSGSGDPVTATTRNIYIDTIAPVINILYPTNNLEIQTFNSTYNNTNFNVSITEAGYFTNCGYYNGTGNTSITCRNNATVNLTNGYFTFAYFANDSVGNLGSNSTTFLVNYIRPLLNYSATGVEGESYTVYFNLTANNITQANASLTFNGTNYAMDIGSYNGTTTAFYKTITLPLVNANTVKSIIVDYYLNNVYRVMDPGIYNMTVYNIPSLNISSGLCSGTPVYWFSLQDEENLSTISGDFEYNFYYGLSNSSMVRTYGKISGANNFSICTNTTISPNWTIGSGEIFYSSTGYVDRRYYIFDGTVVTSATNLTLYDLLSTSQTSFKLEIEDTSLNPYENVYSRLLRWYPDLNEYKIVDMGKTDDTGSTVIHVRTEDVDYRIGAYYTNGSLIYLAQPIRMVCLASPCTYTLKISPGEIDYTSFLNIVYTFTYNETTGIWDFVYSDTTGKTSTMNLTVYRVTSTSIYPVCSNTISGAVGSLTCNTSIYTTGELRAEVQRSASPPVVIVQKVVHLFTTAFKGSSFGLWLSLLLGLPVVFLFALISPIGALLGGIIALIPALYFGSINIGIVGGLAILAGIVAHFLKRVS